MTVDYMKNATPKEVFQTR